MEKKEKIQYLLGIYDRQHYFVDRHDSMAEKFMNVLLIETTCISIIYTMVFNSISAKALEWYHIVSVIAFVGIFVLTLIKLLRIVQPLSSKAKKGSEGKIVKNTDKENIRKSIFYYQGIASLEKNAEQRKKSPVKQYLKEIEHDNLLDDLAQQIFILTQYSEYKKKKLEKATKWIIWTTITGVFAVCMAFI